MCAPGGARFLRVQVPNPPASGKDIAQAGKRYVAGKASLNDTFDRYMSAKYNLRESTRSWN